MPNGINKQTLQVSQGNIINVKNNSGATLIAGTSVYASGTHGASGKILIDKFIANDTIPGKYFIGILPFNIENGADGIVTSFGTISTINTSAWNEGDVLYPSATVAGELTNVAPVHPNYTIPTSIVITKHAVNGKIMVRVPTTQIDELFNIFVPYTGGLFNVDLGVNNLTVDTNSLFVNSATHRVGIGTLAPTQKLSVNGSQNITGTLGIGVGTPSARLHVHSSVAEDVLIVRANNTSQWKIDQYGTLTYSTGGLSFGYDPNILTNAHSSRGDTYITSGLGSASAFNIILKPSGTGNVGIGGSTPNAQLEVGNSWGAQVSGNSSGRGVFGSNFATNTSGQLYTPNTHGSYGFAGVSPNWGNIDFYTSSGATVANTVVTPTPVMRIASNGNVGIGTTTPTATAHIFSNQANCLVVERSVASANATIQYKSGTTSLFAGLSNAGNFGIGASADLSTAFFTGTSTGKIGIGIITPTALLHINAGTTTVAPLKLTSGTNLTTVQDGAFEYNGTTLYFTVGTTRKTVTLV